MHCGKTPGQNRAAAPGPPGCLGRMDGTTPAPCAGRPCCWCKGGQFFGQVGGIIPVDWADLFPLNLELGHTGIIAPADFADLLRRIAQHPAQDRADSRSVRDDHDFLAVPLPRELPDAAQHPVSGLHDGLPARHLTGPWPCLPARKHFGRNARQDFPGLVLPLAHIDLAQHRAQAHLHALAVGDGLGRMARAVKVRRVHCIQRHIGKPVCQIRELPEPALGQQAVILPMAAAVYIALGLGMADQIYRCHTCTAPVSSVTLSTPCWSI